MSSSDSNDSENEGFFETFVAIKDNHDLKVSHLECEKTEELIDCNVAENNHMSETLIYERKAHYDNTPIEKSSIRDTMESKSDFLRFIDRVGLSNFYPAKISLMEVMKIQAKKHTSTYSDIPWMVLRNLMMINFTSRDKMVEEILDSIPDENPEPVYVDDIWSELGICHSRTTINPLDLLLAAFMCCSPALKNILAAKMFMCKLAIPFVFPSEDGSLILSYTPLHSVVIDDTSAGVRKMQKMSVDCPCQVVTFIRLGRPSVSKSKFINSLLSDGGHETFFNENCPLGSTSRSISEGLIEVAWYIPSGVDTKLGHVTTILNLRGDGAIHKKQLSFLSRIKSCFVVFIELNSMLDPQYTETLLTLHQASACGIIMAIDALQNDERSIKQVCTGFNGRVLKYKERTKLCLLAKNKKLESVSEVTKKIGVQISNLIKDTTVATLATRILANACDSVTKDEDSLNCRQSRNKAQELLQMIPDNLNVKDIITPLQGETWRIWSTNLKIINKSSKFTSIQEKDSYEKEMKKQRQNQLNIYRDSHPFMKSCLDTLIKTSDDDSEFILLVEWLKLLLDDRTRMITSICLEKYQCDLQTLKLAKQEQKTKDVLEQLESDVKKSRNDLEDASFKFEHIMREVGQIYEALKACLSTITTNEQNMLTKLPKIGAKLLLHGNPFEIMDGETTNIPNTWVEAVLLHLKDMIGNKKLLALSVVGVQSSGKSTLLNTMFGLQFAVSAGRCTSGVFIQLVPVLEECFSFDYILVTDTEGLRAPKHGVAHEHNHDNMLATFVIGLGDIAIVNIKGENVSEVKDILQISVHAFLRLKLANKRLNLKQSCVFVHQNVAAADADNKMITERQTFVETLDEMAKAAADQENIADIQTFSQVIDFDSEENVSYFSDLWRGDPPMAPVNPGYSRRVCEVRNAIIYRIASKRETYLTITDTVSRIEDLWEGILKDDFVYSFRNSLELKAYSEIERKYNSLAWDLEKIKCLYILSQAKTKLHVCTNNEDLQISVSKIVSDLSLELDDNVARLEEDFVSFIETSALKEVMIQWQQTKLNRLKMLSEELKVKSRCEINNLKEEIRIERIRTSERTKHEIEINEHARKLAYEMKGQMPDDEVIEKTFNVMWTTWLNQFGARNTVDIISVKDQIHNLLCEKFASDVGFIKSRETESGLEYSDVAKLEGSVSMNRISDKDISSRNLLNKSACEESLDVYKRQAIDVVNNIFRKIDLRLEELKQQDIRFDISYVFEILNLIVNDIAAHNEHRVNDYKFNLPTTFRAMIITHVVCYLTVFFTNLSDKYDKKHSPRGQMEEYKRTAWTLFKNLVESKTEDMIIVGFFTEGIKKQITSYVSTLMPTDIADKICLEFTQAKYTLIKFIMIDMLNRDNFEDIISYIREPATFVRRWISNFTHKTIFDDAVGEKTQYGFTAERRLNEVFTKLVKSISLASEFCNKSETVAVSDWLRFVMEYLSSTYSFPLPAETFVHIQDRNVSDLDNMTHILLKEMYELKMIINREFAETTRTTVQWSENVILKIMDQLWGCEKHCMYCREPCKNTIRTHFDDDKALHHCIQHRPQGIGGYSKMVDDTLVVEFCNVLIQTDTRYVWFEENGKVFRKYKNYKEYHPEWDIQPSYDKHKYWKYVMCRYQHELANYYKHKLPHIPETWINITKEEAINSLSDVQS